MLTVLTFYNLRKENFLKAGIFSLLASLTRFMGVALVLAIITEIYFSKARGKQLGLLGVLGIFLYGGFLYFRVGDPLYFLVAQENWHRNLVFPLTTVFNEWKLVFSKPETLINILTLIFGVGMLFQVFKRLRHSYFVYALISIVIPMFSSTLLSFPRFLLPIFPIFIALGTLKNKNVLLMYQFLAILFLGIFISFFINGYWVS